MSEQVMEEPVEPVNHRLSGAMTLEEENLQLFLRGAVKFMESFVPLAEAFGRLQTAMEEIFLRQSTREGMRASVGIANSFRNLGVAASDVKTQLDMAKSSATKQQHLAETHIKQGQIRPALTAINVLYSELMDMYPKILMVDEKNDRVLSRASHANKLELEGLDYPKVVAFWKDEYGKWLSMSKRTVWADEAPKTQVVEDERAK